MADDWSYVENGDWAYVENGDETGVECFLAADVAERNPSRSHKYTTVAEATKLVDGVLVKFGMKRGLVQVGFSGRSVTRRIGSTAHRRRTGETKIMLNKWAWPVLTPEERHDTILHEAAHAVQFIHCGSSNHGPQWKKVARAVGCSGERCIDLSFRRLKQIEQNYLQRRNR